MRFAAVVVVLVSWLVLDESRAHPPPILSVEQEKAGADEVAAFRRSMAKIARENVSARLKAFYAPSFVHTDSIGSRFGRDERLAQHLAGEPLIEAAESDDVVVRNPGGWTAVATGRCKLPARDGKSYWYVWSAVYVRTETGWQLAASHANRLGEAVR